MIARMRAGIVAKKPTPSPAMAPNRAAPSVWAPIDIVHIIPKPHPTQNMPKATGPHTEDRRKDDRFVC